MAKDQWLADKNAYKASKDAAASEEPVAASPSSEVLEVGPRFSPSALDQTISAQVPVAKPALVEETSDTSGESSTDAGEESGASSPETSDDEEEKVAATLKKSKKRTPALSSPVPATPAKARKSRSKP